MNAREFLENEFPELLKFMELNHPPQFVEAVVSALNAYGVQKQMDYIDTLNNCLTLIEKEFIV